jgi:protein required for attachment to host cells
MSTSIPENTLVVVADGGKALMFRRTGTGGR